MAAELERIVTRLVADTKDWSRGLTLAQGQLGTFQRTSGSTLTQIGAGFTKLAGVVGISLSVGALAAFSKRALEAADDVGDLSAAAGMSAEKFQRLQYAMSFSGVSAEEFSAAMTTAARTVGGFFAEQERAVKAFGMLGISADDASMQLMSQDEIIEKLLARLQEYGSHQERVAAASRIFGESVGAKFVAAAEQGMGAVRDMMAQARVLSDEQVRVATEVNDAWERVTTEVGVRLRGAFISALAATTNFVSSFSLEQISREIAKLELQLEELREGTVSDKFTLSTSTRRDRNKERVAELEAEIKELRDEQARRLRQQHQADPEELARQRKESSARIKAEQESEEQERNIARGRERAKRDSYEAEAEGLLKKYEREDRIREEAARKAEREEAEIARGRAQAQRDSYQAEYEQLMRKYEREDALEEEKREKRQRAELEIERDIARRKDEERRAERERIERFNQELSETIADFATDSERAWERLKHRVIQAIAEMTIRWLQSGIGQPVGAGGRGGAGGPAVDWGAILGGGGRQPGSTPPIFPMHAAGGSPMIGRAALVGERGPELFVPRTAGVIVPSGRFSVGGQGGGTTRVELGVQVVVEPGMTVVQQRRRDMDGRERARIVVRNGVQDELGRRGELGRFIAAETGQRQAPRRGIS